MSDATPQQETQACGKCHGSGKTTGGFLDCTKCQGTGRVPIYDVLGRRLDRDGWPACWSDPKYLGDGAEGA